VRSGAETDTVSPMLEFGQPPPGPLLALPTPAGAGVATFALPATDLAAPRPAPHCPPDHLLVLTTAGHGTVDVDFATQACRPGTLLWIRPGQAVRFGGQPGHETAIITWARDLHPSAELAGAALEEPFGPVRWQLAGEDEDAVINEFTQLAFDCQQQRTGPVSAALLRHQLAVLLLRIALLAGAESPANAAESGTFLKFRQELERSHPESRRVEDYAARLGCSVRTLTRASLTVTGRTAKQLVDDRVALAAKRLLACSQLSIAEVGRQLGFPEPTNFGRFFHREVGLSPGAFRAALSNGGPPPRLPAPSGPHVPAPRRPADAQSSDAPPTGAAPSDGGRADDDGHADAQQSPHFR
jgi:AraC-like DNA-binding protein